MTNQEEQQRETWEDKREWVANRMSHAGPDRRYYIQNRGGLRLYIDESATEGVDEQQAIATERILNALHAENERLREELDDVLLKDRGKTQEINILTTENRELHTALKDAEERYEGAPLRYEDGQPANDAAEDEDAWELQRQEAEAALKARAERAEGEAVRLGKLILTGHHDGHDYVHVERADYERMERAEASAQRWERLYADATREVAEADLARYKAEASLRYVLDEWVQPDQRAEAERDLTAHSAEVQG